MDLDERLSAQASKLCSLILEHSACSVTPKPLLGLAQDIAGIFSKDGQVDALLSRFMQRHHPRPLQRSGVLEGHSI